MPDFEAGNYQNKYYSYQTEFKYVPGSHSSALLNECIVLKSLVTYVSELVLAAEKMCILRPKSCLKLANTK